MDTGEVSETGSSAKKSLNFNLLDSMTDGSKTMAPDPKRDLPETKKKSWYEITLEEEEEEAAQNFNQPRERSNQSMAERERLAVIDEDEDKTMEPDATQLAKGRATVLSEETDEDVWKIGEDFYTEEEMMNDDLLIDEVNELLEKDPIYEATQKKHDTSAELSTEELMDEDTDRATVKEIKQIEPVSQEKKTDGEGKETCPTKPKNYGLLFKDEGFSKWPNPTKEERQKV
ncbi:unnamed protein product [Arabis nemorensis]|uniref:Uncharacterized protein n=1 Tax=Arabis nemorensis TaxID=586526 RepID=A0A565C782_9BRAS|nr:unnamed protein product [Arabis nemorensis]